MSFFNLCFGGHKKSKKCSCSGCSKSRAKYRKKDRKKNGSDSSDGNNYVCKKQKSRDEIEKNRYNGMTEISQNHSQAAVGMYGPNIPHITFMPVSRDSPSYNMSHPRRGKAIIFNFDKWENTGIKTLDDNPRRGSEKDKRDLERTLKELEFDVECHDNCKNDEFEKILKRMSKFDHSQNDLFMLILLTHGEKNTIYLADGVQIPVNLIWEKFEADKCPSLAAKPKIFIIQACRGDKYDAGTILAPRIMSGSAANLTTIIDVTDSVNFSYTIPNAADFLICFSCPVGHYSFRNPEKGSWFIQSICKIFKESAYQTDVQNLFTTIARDVALNYESTTDNIESNKKKQVTSTSSTLIRLIKLAPKGKPAVPSKPSKTITSTSSTFNEINNHGETEFFPLHQKTIRPQIHIDYNNDNEEIINENGFAEADVRIYNGNSIEVVAVAEDFQTQYAI